MKTKSRLARDPGASSSAGADLGSITWARVGPPTGGKTGDLGMLGMQNRHGVLPMEVVVLDRECFNGLDSIEEDKGPSGGVVSVKDN